MFIYEMYMGVYVCIQVIWVYIYGYVYIYTSMYTGDMGVTLGIMCGGVCRQLGDTHTVQCNAHQTLNQFNPMHNAHQMLNQFNAIKRNTMCCDRVKHTADNALQCSSKWCNNASNSAQ